MALKVNVGSGERWLRVVMGPMMIGAGLYFSHGGGYMLAAAGAMMAMTGLLRWCPMCALGGCRLPESH